MREGGGFLTCYFFIFSFSFVEESLMGLVLIDWAVLDFLD